MQRLIRISDPEDPRIAAFRDIRERDLVGRKGRFVAEGRVVLNVLLTAARYETEAVLLLENRVGGLDELLPMIPDDVPVYVADAATMERPGRSEWEGAGRYASGMLRNVFGINSRVLALETRVVVEQGLEGVAGHGAAWGFQADESLGGG